MSNINSTGVLIPQDIVGIKEFQSTAKYILVVEKDAIFQKLLDEGALLRLGPVIIITVIIIINLVPSFYRFMLEFNIISPE